MPRHECGAVRSAGAMGDDAPLLYDVRHVTRYAYEDAVAMSQHLLHLQPLSNSWQHCHHHRIEVTPSSDETWIGVDFFGNRTSGQLQPSAEEFCVARAGRSPSSRAAAGAVAPLAGLGIGARSPGDARFRRRDPRRFLFECPHSTRSAPSAPTPCRLSRRAGRCSRPSRPDQPDPRRVRLRSPRYRRLDPGPTRCCACAAASVRTSPI